MTFVSKRTKTRAPEPELRPIQRLLAANRSEIAIRIFRAANDLNLHTIAGNSYSQEDRLSLHRFKADEAYEIGAGKGPVEAYLDIPGIVGLAREKHIDAIHPGYGFLSENPAFARACDEAGVTFIGPPPELLELLGDKTAARRLAASAGVPILPRHRGSRAVPSRGTQGGPQNRLSFNHQGRHGGRRPRHARCSSGRGSRG